MIGPPIDPRQLGEQGPGYRGAAPVEPGPYQPVDHAAVRGHGAGFGERALGGAVVRAKDWGHTQSRACLAPINDLP